MEILDIHLILLFSSPHLWVSYVCLPWINTRRHNTALSLVLMPFYVFIKCWDKVSAWLTNSFEPASGNLEHDSRLSWTLRGLIEQKWLMFCRWQYQNWFLRWKFVYFDYNFNEVCSSGSNGSMMVHHWSLNKNCAIWNRIFFNVFNSLWPSDAIWRCRLGWTLAQVMTWQLIVSLKKKKLIVS